LVIIESLMIVACRLVIYCHASICASMRPSPHQQSPITNQQSTTNR
jgi:hypothetical protein